MAKSKIKSFSTVTPLLGGKYPIDIVKTSIKEYIKRLKKAKLDLSNEYIAVKLDRDDLEKFLNDGKTAHLVAFFGVEPERKRTTIFIGGLTASGKVVKNGTDYELRERWDGKFLTADIVDANPNTLDRVFP